MTASLDRPPSRGWIRTHERYLWAGLVVVALATGTGLWYWSQADQVANLSLGSGIELRYLTGLTDILCQEALSRDLKLEIRKNGRSVEAIQKVDRRELDAAVIPAGLAVTAQNVRQVTMLDCEALQLFVRPEVHKDGLPGLRGRSINLGPEGTGVRIIATEVLNFLGLKPGDGFRISDHSYQQLLKLAPDAMPDAVFSLSPLPSPLGQKLVNQYGFQLMELPLGEALMLRKPYFEDTRIPASTYGATPPVPSKAVQTVGTRSVLIAHCDVPKATIQRLLETLYESDFSQRAGIRSLDPASMRRLGEYPTHVGTFAYIHRSDPWFDQKLVDKFKHLQGTAVSIVSAVLLAWQWLRRRQVHLATFFYDCNQLDLGAQRAASSGEFGDTELAACLVQLARLKMQILEQHHKRFLAGDRQCIDLVNRIEVLQQTLPSLVRTTRPADRIALAFPAPQRKAA